MHPVLWTLPSQGMTGEGRPLSSSSSLPSHCSLCGMLAKKRLLFLFPSLVAPIPTQQNPFFRLSCSTRRIKGQHECGGRREGRRLAGLAGWVYVLHWLLRGCVYSVNKMMKAARRWLGLRAVTAARLPAQHHTSHPSPFPSPAVHVLPLPVHVHSMCRPSSTARKIFSALAPCLWDESPWARGGEGMWKDENS